LFPTPNENEYVPESAGFTSMLVMTKLWFAGEVKMPMSVKHEVYVLSAGEHATVVICPA